MKGKSKNLTLSFPATIDEDIFSQDRECKRSSRVGKNRDGFSIYLEFKVPVTFLSEREGSSQRDDGPHFQRVKFGV